MAADGNPFNFLGNFFQSWSRLTSAATSLTGCEGAFSKAGFVSAPEARKEAAHGETVGFLVKESPAPDGVAESTVIHHFFAPSGADDRRIPFIHGYAAGYYLTLRRS